MLQDSTFRDELKCRWVSLRSNILNTTNLFNYIDSAAVYLDSAQQRHQEKWATLGVDVGTPEVGTPPATFQADINFFKSWISTRIAWLDANMPGTCLMTGINKFSEANAITLFPNPTSDMVFINSENKALTNSTSIIISDLLGKEVISQSYKEISNNGMAVSLTNFESGTYLCRFVNNGKDVLKPVKLIIQK